ncbi:50S ribosomal protein L25 [Corynebacterium atypicum]|uniref:Large ribosomal subunit protein bL25 n=1 Tax=Corynebacterium atypicum TaxID=191610 RepID=A0ABM5QMD0_9CORY|nr:50S ribosomal protein L25/general stress protein Ctc [Corynebacterium atypicum]AIG63888.1 50S ribosomal protein L25 [Corynebacterium atypicum]
MADYLTIKAEPRTEFGKGAARRLRRDWRVPGVIYSAGTETIHFSVPLLEIQALVRNHGVNAIVEIELEGEKHLTMVKHVDQNVLTFDIDHVDLLGIKRGEKVEVEVPITVEGESQPGTIAVQDAYELLVEADVLNIPEEITVSVEGLEVDSKIVAGDLQMPGNTSLVADPETLIVSIQWPEPEEDEDAEDEAAAAIDQKDASDVEATEEDAD